jgi:hypothetical protein
MDMLNWVLDDAWEQRYAGLAGIPRMILALI